MKPKFWKFYDLISNVSKQGYKSVKFDKFFNVMNSPIAEIEWLYVERLIARNVMIDIFNFSSKLSLIR